MHRINQTLSHLNKTILVLLVIPFLSHELAGQLFVQDPGAISTTMSDSRSVNFLDLNNDGWQEAFISNGPSGGQKDLLYANIASGILLPVTGMDIVEAVSPSDGASFADYNNDGHIDAIVSSWYGEEDLLYLNNRNGKLEYNENAGIASGSFAETAVFGDYDNDGWLDIYVTHSGGDRKNFLYRNLKNGKFERILNHTLVNESKPSRGAIFGDFNDDGHQDLFVANEGSNNNDIFFGTGNGDYTKYLDGNIVNSSRGSITGSWGDIDNDGDLDLFVGNTGNFSGQANQLFRNNGNVFIEVTNDAVAQDNKCTFGSSFADYDNDGDLDLAVSNGFCNGGMANDLFENQGDGSFKKVSNLLVANNNICSYGLAWGDVNNDGFLDLLIANCKNGSTDLEHANSLLRNQGNQNNWLQVNLVGVQSNRNAIGAKLRMLSTINGKEIWQRRDVSAQSGYAGQNSLVSHFGLGNAQIVDSLIIYWPSGIVEKFADLEINKILKIEEGMLSAVNEVENSQNISLSVYPNPLLLQDSSLQLSIESQTYFPSAEIVFTDILGNMVTRKAIQINQGKTNVILPISKGSVLPGIYQITMLVDRTKISQKLVISDY